MPPFVSTAPSDKPESVKTINAPAARSLRNAKRIKRKKILCGKNKSTFHKKSSKNYFYLQEEKKPDKNNAFQNLFIMSKIQRK